MLTSISQLHDLAKKTSKKKLVLAAAHDENALEAVGKACEAGIVEAILVGIKEKIVSLAEDNKINISKMRIIDESSLENAAAIAVKLVRDKEADILMKGNLATAILLKAVLNKEWGLRSGDLLSHLALFEAPSYHKLIAITDAAMNIAPDFAAKTTIIKNAVDYLCKLGIKKPKVAILAAVETVNEAMPITMEAAAVTKMADRGQIKNCIIDGPLAFDNAVSKHSAEHKGIISPVAGDADLLMCGNIEAANMLYKAFIYFANAQCAAVIVGANAPIVLTSRADSDETKLNSIALAAATN
ncbi:MAG: bifunctional enoyl-CoA hydratase/phosphate acetyltransferase [Bacteroidales bacterium]|nr:bifunctional enoyl-CoA hydratase/phosphate acetyltransferase [Bacteroidales bacterium]